MKFQYTLSFGLQRGVADLESRWADYQPDRSLRNRANKAFVFSTQS